MRNRSIEPQSPSSPPHRGAGGVQASPPHRGSGEVQRAGEIQASPPNRGAGGVWGVEPLSQRELEVLQWIASGASNREIGRRLYITESTVKRHVYNIFGKLSVRNRTQAALKAAELGNLPTFQL